jgi:hypothetical protein
MKKSKFPSKVSWNTRDKEYSGAEFYTPVKPPRALNKLNATRRTVWEYLASCCINKPWCWPSIRKIAKDVNLDPKTVHSCVRDLQAARMILFEAAPWMGKREKRRPVNIYFVFGMGITYSEARHLLRDKTSNWYLTGKRNNSHISIVPGKGEGQLPVPPSPPLPGDSGESFSLISDPDKGTIRPRFSWHDQHNGNLAPFAMSAAGVQCKDLSTARDVSASEQGLLPDDPEEDTELDDLMATAEQGLMSPITDSVDESDAQPTQVDALAQPSRLVSSNPEPHPRKSGSRPPKTFLRAFADKVCGQEFMRIRPDENLIQASGRACGASWRDIDRCCNTGEWPLPWAKNKKEFLDSLESASWSGVYAGYAEMLDVPIDTDLGDVWPVLLKDGYLTPAEIIPVVHGPLTEKQVAHLLTRPEIKQRLAETQGYGYEHSRETTPYGPLWRFKDDLAAGEIYPDVKSLAEWWYVLQQVYPIDPPEKNTVLVKQYQHGEEQVERGSPEEQALWAQHNDTVAPDEIFKNLVSRPQTISAERRIMARPDFQAYLARTLGFPSYEDLKKAHDAGEISPTQYGAIDWWDALENVVYAGTSEPEPRLEFALGDPVDYPQPVPAYAEACNQTPVVVVEATRHSHRVDNPLFITAAMVANN